MAAFTIRGKNVEVTPAMKDYVEKKIGKVTKYFDRVGDISVLLSVIKDRHLVEVTVPVEGIILRGEESTMDMYTSIDLVIEKLERQIRKHKTKIQRRFKEGSLKEEAFKQIPPEEVDTEDEYNIVKKKRFFVRPMDVQEAIMQMNLVGHDFFMFLNVETDRVSVVYKRADNTYGLIESDK